MYLQICLSEMFRPFGYVLMYHLYLGPAVIFFLPSL